MSGDARTSTTSSHQVFFPPLQGKALKEIHVILIETLGEHAPSYATVKNWVAQFKRGDKMGPPCLKIRILLQNF
jgi:hypothetical protein